MRGRAAFHVRVLLGASRNEDKESRAYGPLLHSLVQLMLRQAPQRVLITRLIGVLAAVPFLVLPLRSLFVEGPFSWHIRQSAAWQGGLEVLALATLVFGALWLHASRWRNVAVGMLAELYARRHGVDLSIAVLWLYIEGIFALGQWLLPFARVALTGQVERAFAAGLFGLIAWSLICWTIAAAGATSTAIFRFAGISVLGAALLVRRSTPTLAGLAGRALQQPDGWSRALMAVIVAFFLALFAKSGTVIDYDSLWYGLQGEKVLLSDHGVFGSPGLVGVVHYYPKLYEMLLMPFAGLGSSSLIFGVGVYSCLFAAATCAAILRVYREACPVGLVGAALVMTLPALANIAITAKGDAFSAWMLLLSIYFVLLFCQKSEGGHWWLAVAAVVLCGMSRLSNLPYVGLASMMLLVIALRRRQMVERLVERSASIGIASAALATLVMARTIKVAGVPLIAPNALVSIERLVGFRLNYPVGLLPDGGKLFAFPQGLLAILFAPASLPHIIITWPGDVWAWLAIVGLVGWCFPKMRDTPLLVVGLAFFAVLFGYKQLVPGGDGNYYIVPVACLTLWGLLQAVRAGGRQFVLPIALMFVLADATIAFVTGSWGPGTRGWDIDFSRMPFELNRRAEHDLHAAELDQVEAFFARKPAWTRVVGLDGTSTNGTPPAWWLSVRYESLNAFLWANPGLVSTPSHLLKYFQDAQIQYVLLPNETTSSSVDPVLRAALSEMESQGHALLAMRDRKYTVWSLERPVATAALSDGGSAELFAPEADLCTNTNTVARVEWSAHSPTIAIEVHAKGALASSLWTEGGPHGQKVTGPWVPRGAEFTLRAGRKGKLLGILRADPACN